MEELFKDKEMRYLGWKNPYGTLMLHGKQETRTWSTNYRGLVLITVSQAPYKLHQIMNISGEHQTKRIMDIMSKYPAGYDMSGYAIAVGRLVDCQPMEKEHEDICFVEYHKDWIESKTTKSGATNIKTMKLWRHIYEDVVPIEPIKFKGAQGWRKLTPEFIETIKIKQ